MPCVPDKGDIGEATRQYKGGAEFFKIDTNWCFSPKKTGALRVLFIIDRSGSMAANDPEGAGCGRLTAVKTFMDSLTAKAGPDGNLQFAAVAFSEDSDTISGFAKPAAFQASLTAEKYCRADATTNYVAAFAEAAKVVDAMPKDPAAPTVPLAVYFITDGMPTSPKAESLAAAKALRDKVVAVAPGSVLNAVFLDVKGGVEGTTILDEATPGQTFTVEQVSQKARELLAGVTGDDSRVKAVSQASDLTAALQELKTPVASVDPATVRIKLEGDIGPKDYDCTDANGCRVVLDPQDPGKWSVKFNIPLKRKPGSVTTHQATVTGKRTDGSDLKAKATVTIDIPAIKK